MRLTPLNASIATATNADETKNAARMKVPVKLQRLRAEEAYTGGISYPHRLCALGCGLCVRQRSLSWRSLRANARKSIGAAPALLLCHGAPLQPVVLCRVYPGRSDGALPGRSPECLGVPCRLPAKILIDNPKTAVLKHPTGERPLFHPRYLDFAAHYGFEPRACNVRKPNEKGRVESGAGYVKKNFLNGLQRPPGLNALNTAARHWMDTVANVRIHGETHKQPIELFAPEKPHLNALPLLPADTGLTQTVPASSRFRVVLDTNRYSVPSLYASQRLLLKTFADRLCIYHDEKLIATHTRSYDRHQDFEDPDHGKQLLDQRRAARDAKLLLRFYGLCPRAEEYYLQLKVHRFIHSKGCEIEL
jgi:hypothetical protein